MRREAQQRAKALRDALESLPRAGAPEGSGRAAAALSREHGAAMAERLERLELDEALDSGDKALGLADEAKSKAERPESIADVTDRDALETARQALSEAKAWAERARAALKNDARERARGHLGEAAERERSIERRTGELGERAEKSEASLPESMLDKLRRARDAMRDAASELGQGRGEAGLSHQREAQRLLEQGGTGRTTDGDERAGDERHADRHGENGHGMGTDAAVPAADDRRRAQEFRRRVLEGLGKERGSRLEPAIRRYAEGLLQ